MIYYSLMFVLFFGVNPSSLFSYHCPNSKGMVDIEIQNRSSNNIIDIEEHNEVH